MAEVEANACSDVVKMGDHVIIQRKGYMKIHKITPKGVVMLGNDKISINDVIGKPLWTTYKMEPVPKSRREFSLTECRDLEELPEDIITFSGADNRGIHDDGSSQKLSKAEIIDLRDSGCSSQEILGQLIENSTSFMNKTEYSQEKYLKKKEKKYFDYITIRQPSVRLVFDILHKLDSTKLLGLRMDTLSQLTTAVDLHSDRTYILYESGCQGVATATMLNSIAEGGNLIHIHPGNIPQKQAVTAMNFDDEQMERLLSVNIYSLLRKLRPEENVESVATENIRTENVESVATENIETEPVSHLERNTEESKPEIDLNDVEPSPNEEVQPSNDMDESEANDKKRKIIFEEDGVERPPKKPRWELITERAADILRLRKADGLVIVAKEHPINIMKALLPWVGLSMPFVVFCLYREPLQELFVYLKSSLTVTSLRMTETWLRAHQVLPSRTHPDVSMSGGGGYILTGVTVEA